MTPAIHILRGDRGDAVLDVKSRLSALGYSTAGAEDPDEFGPATEAAVRAFQSDRGLRVDGICGSETWSALVESGYGLGDRLLYLRRPMLRGDDVGRLQRILNALGFDAGKEDRIFGVETVDALREFQRNAGLTVDGICGPETVSALQRLGPRTDGSVAQARERESMRQHPRGLAEHRIFLAVEPDLVALGDVVRHGLAECGANVIVETATGDHSGLAAEANRFRADLVVLLRFGDASGPTCAYYSTGESRSERGHRVATCVREELARIPELPPVQSAGKAYTILRETRAPAVVCEPAVATDLAGVRALVTHSADLGTAIVSGVRRSIEEPLDEPSS